MHTCLEVLAPCLLHALFLSGLTDGGTYLLVLKREGGGSAGALILHVPFDDKRYWHIQRVVISVQEPLSLER